MRAKVLTVVYAAIAVQRFLLPVPQKLPTITDGASMLTEMIVILGFSVLASFLALRQYGEALARYDPV